MTRVNGLHLAYRGFVAGLAAGYVWLAAAMGLAALLQHDPLAPLRPVAAVLVPEVGASPAAAFVIGYAVVQLCAALVGMVFAYFFARYFTVRPTLAAAAPCFALLAWALLTAGAGHQTEESLMGLAAVPVLATVAYGLLLGAALPLRGDVLRTVDARQAGSPST